MRFMLVISLIFRHGKKHQRMEILLQNSEGVFLDECLGWRGEEKEW